MNGLISVEYEANALALEYQRYYGTASRNIDITDVLDDPLLKGVGRVFGPGFLEEITNLAGVKVCSVSEDITDPGLIGEDGI